MRWQPLQDVYRQLGTDLHRSINRTVENRERFSNTLNVDVVNRHLHIRASFRAYIDHVLSTCSVCLISDICYDVDMPMHVSNS